MDKIILPGSVDVKTGETDKAKYCIEIRNTSNSDEIIGYLPYGLTAEDKQRMKENDELRSRQLNARYRVDLIVDSDDNLKGKLSYWRSKIGLPDTWFFIRVMGLIEDFKMYINNFEYFEEMLKAFDLVPVILSSEEVEQLKGAINQFDELYNKEFTNLCNEV